MRRLCSVLILAALAFFAPASAAHADAVRVGFWYGAPYYRPYYRPYFAPPVVVTPASAVYVEPAPQVVVAQPAYPAPAVVAIDPSEPVFVDRRGRTCRHFKTTQIVNGFVQTVRGKACLAADGTWRATN